MLTIIIIVLLILALGGGGYYGRGRWYGTGVTGVHPMSIVWIIVIVLLIVWLIGELGVVRYR